jgi:prepilin-type N-terminal cleavage/methylation domain-containing protein
MHRLHKRQSGFTVIEMMIVLAVAGVIMLIVFLAVPALQRSARNTERKNDAAAIAGAVATFSNDNNGPLPNRIRNDTTNQAFQVDFSIDYDETNFSTATLSYYNHFVSGDTSWGHDADNINITVLPVTTPLTPTVLPVSQTNTAICQDSSGVGTCQLTTETAAVITGENCNATYNGRGQISRGSFAIFYVVETGSGNGALECASQ